SSRRRHTRLQGDWSSDVCSSDLARSKARAGLWRLHRLSLDPAAPHCQCGREASACALDQSAERLTDPATGFHFREKVMQQRLDRSEERRVGKECGEGWAGERETK